MTQRKLEELLGSRPESRPEQTNVWACTERPGAGLAELDRIIDAMEQAIRDLTKRS